MRPLTVSAGGNVRRRWGRKECAGADVPQQGHTLSEAIPDDHRVRFCHEGDQARFGSDRRAAHLRLRWPGAHLFVPRFARHMRCLRGRVATSADAGACNGTQQVFRDLTTQYWKNANMVMLVYDVTKPETFENLGPWLELVRRKCPEKALPGVVVANKIDCEERQRVFIPEGQEFAKSNHLEFVQVSAARNQNVEKPFETISELFHSAYEEHLDFLAGL